jgi:protein-tyrosine-phosphatase
MGYSPSGLSSKGLDEVPIETFDVVVSLIGSAGLRLLPPSLGEQRLEWSVRDPFGDDRDVYRVVARELEQRIRKLLEVVADDREGGGNFGPSIDSH